MYTAYCDGELMFDQRSDSLKLLSAKLDLELNKTGSFTFTIAPSNPYYNRLAKLATIITVYDDDDLIFRGRVLNDESGFYNTKQVTCEGELAFLLDSIMRPYNSETDPWVGTPEQYLSMLLENHNSQVEDYKKFKLGTVTVQSAATTGNITRYDADYKTTWDLISEKLVGSLGGYLWVRHEASGNYLDYVADFSSLNYSQTIEIGKNLLNVNKTNKGETIITALIPVGGENEGAEKKLTIESIPDGEIARIDVDGEEGIIYKSGDYIYCDKAVEKYGWIFATNTWSDIKTDVTQLKTVAVNYLDNAINVISSIELTSADLAHIENVNPFRLSTRVIVVSEQHGLSNESFLIEKLSLNLLKPSDNTLTVGKTYQTFTEGSTSGVATQAQIIERVDQIEKKVSEGGVTKDELAASMNTLREENSSLVNQSSTEILSQISQDYYLQSDADALVQSTETQFKQTSSEFELRFNELALNIDDVQSGADAQFAAISKYIRFVDGNIILGESGNELTLKIQHDRISFLEGGVEVAYLSNRKLYVTDGEYINSLRLGNYAFIPRANGNLSFKKVT